MRKLLNTLYITTPNSYLSIDGENIVVLIEDEKKFRIPLINVENIICFNYMGFSPKLAAKCVENNISINILNPNGEFMCKINGKTHGNVLLRKEQYKLSDDKEFSLKISQNIISAKIANSYSVQKHFLYEHRDLNLENLKNVSNILKKQSVETFNFNNMDELRGFEGSVAKKYFETFNEMILTNKRDFDITSRSKRPPLDYTNCMLSYLYTLLSLEIRSALETVGLDPFVGFMHTLRPGRASLALDLMEELRAVFVDKLVIKLINLNQISKKDFEIKESGAVLFTDNGRKLILNAWQEQKKEIIKHPYTQEKFEFGLIPYAQALILAKSIRGEITEYQPFLFK